MCDLYNRRPRIVCSLTTIPSRLCGLEATVSKIIRKMSNCDKFYLNIPYQTSRSRVPYIIPENFLSSIEECYREKIEINRCEDYGPITKLIPTLLKETNPTTIIITFDDDVRLKKDISEIIVEKHRQYPSSCLSFSGFCVGTFPFLWQFAVSNKRDLECDWIQGVHCIAYPRGMIDVHDLLEWKTHIFKHDDHRINSFLAHKGIKRISMGHNPGDFFYQDMDLAKTDAISGSTEFIIQNAKLCYTFKREKLYGHNHPSLWVTSIIGLVFLGFLLAVLVVYINSFFVRKDWVFILIYAIILFTILYVILFNSMLV